MNVLIADKFEPAGIDALRAGGCTVDYQPSLDGDTLRDAIAEGGCAVLVVRSTRVTEAMLAASGSLNVVVRAGAGYNTIDTEAASRRSILVANCPGKNAVAVAELTFALILGLDRRLVENVVDLRRGAWNKKEYGAARGLKGRTLGLVGFGQIGQAVARRAAAFGMAVVAWSRSLTPEGAAAAGVSRGASPADVAERCDILSIHLAETDETRRIIIGAVLSKMAPGGYVINTSRAGVLDYAALRDAIAERGLRVGLDVFPDEPTGGTGQFTDGIVRSDGLVYGTHHIGASTDQAQEAIASETVRIVLSYMATGRVENCVNRCARSPARHLIVLRHRNRPGVLAHTLSVIRHAGINVQEMENVICEGAHAAVAQIKLDRAASDDVISAIRTGNEHVLGVSTFAVTG